MASTLNPENIPEHDRRLGSGHGTAALGPSDTSDSGSDVQGGLGLEDELDAFGLDRGTTSDPDNRIPANSAGPDVGDANLDSDSDAGGTGERASAGRDISFSPGRDIDVDHIEHLLAEDFEHDDSDRNVESERNEPGRPDRPQMRPR